MSGYQEFLATKTARHEPAGVDVGDLLLEAEAKWRTLSDPDSGHRSA